MGFAYYGRSYKLADSNCRTMGCSFTAKRRLAAGPCTHSARIMSNREIRKVIQEQKITPYLSSTAMVKCFTYLGDNRIGYDDEETFALTRAFADDRCLGGIMI
jgi:chitinase